MWLDTFNEMRKKSGMSLDEISVKSGVPKGTLAKITSGITKAPTLETMKSLVYAMGYTLKDLDDGFEEKKPTPVAESGLALQKIALIQKILNLDLSEIETLNQMADSVLGKRDG